jgi:hypothetical protein
VKLYEVREFSTLSPRLRAWLKEFAATDGSLEAATEALLTVGYKQSRTLPAKARKFMREHRTLINQAVRLRMQDTGRVMLAMNAVDELVRDKAGSGAVRLNAAKDIMAKAGLEEAQKLEVGGSDPKKLTDEDLIKKIAEYQERLKLVNE